MVDMDLVVAIRNALERGQHAEQAVLSLINAGYEKQDVEEASKQAQMMHQGMQPVAAPKPFPLQSPPNKKSPKKIILLLIFLLGILAVSIIIFLFSKIF